ncbi:ArsR/SmtB family transcription factor [Dictyoglomus thermophilum]|uniref:Transcriptional regulatory protein n=2 Tax=Dictyoglomus thermophilum TaxID=14 RepID=B5YFF9_DICT6|nr:metalloregulator ArsR/SmtB family transcription factor [Dictyoglomus thermophilum]ACI19870.1 transcriptional regulatory protein [Dictyoglomus thermophilum H-6-12]MCX7719816.1 metalloregulator ArsR/SmtB family transcription factor [Dictyoglomus thermophilum]TYT22730.1 helix-turn-helix transcriptional regulator [Dictyoglomus thermophilum]
METKDKERLSIEECEALSDIFKSLSSYVRIHILCALSDGEKSAGEIAKLINASFANTSQNLKDLYNLGLLKKRRVGQFVYYSLADDSVLELLELVRRIRFKSKKA